MATILGIVTVTVVCWGTYGPVLHLGQVAMEGSRLRPFIGVGVAYFMVAVILPLILGPRIHEPGRWTAVGILWSIFAGLLGALGSLGVIFAFHAGGTPVFVMPLVFGGAPVVNTLVTLTTSRSATKPGVGFYIGIVLVALGAAGVLKFKPQPAVTPSVETASERTSMDPVPAAADKAVPAAADKAVPAAADKEADRLTAAGDEVRRQTWWGFLGTIGAIGMTAVCWGSYGPTLHRGQAAMCGSRLRPFLCVGISYFVVAIVIPAAMLMKSPEPGEWNLGGLLWSLAAGGLGAFGALGVIMAFTCGGKPSYVMPIVFGGAPVVNTATTMLESWCRHGSYGEITPLFLAALGTVIVGAVTVLLFAPKTPTGSAHSQSSVPPADEAVSGQPKDEEGVNSEASPSSGEV